MTTTNSFIDKFSAEEDEAIYDPSVEENKMVPEGTYPAHITGLNIKRNITVRGRYLADIYVPTFTIAKEANDASGMKVNDENYGAGVFRFKKPDDSSGLEDRKGGGNVWYHDFVKYLGIEPEKKTTDSGNTIYRLPLLAEEDAIGKPVLIEVQHQKYKSADGTEKSSVKASVTGAWTEGNKIKVDDVDLPF
tara:strand:+ start:800 stop:1372 length:573 start_codon:yes stop_codon:yes gene_type:complete